MAIPQASLLTPLTLKGQIAQAIRMMIFRGEASPGDPLREIALARQFGVSQSTIREALIELEHRGLVRRETNRRTEVTQLSAREIGERVELRILLETSAAQKAAANLDASGLTELKQALQKLKRQVEQNNYYESAVADQDFHQCIWKASGNLTLCDSLERITAPLMAFMSIRRSAGHEKLPSVFRPHEPIVKAIEAKDHHAIAAAIESHIRGSYARFMK